MAIRTIWRALASTSFSFALLATLAALATSACTFMPRNISVAAPVAPATPATDCVASGTPAPAAAPAVAASDATDTVLGDSISRVRHWPYFKAPDVAADPVSEKELQEIPAEALRLVSIAQAVTALAQATAAKDAAGMATAQKALTALGPKPAETTLVANMPAWVGQKNVLWQDITTDINQLKKDTSGVIEPVNAPSQDSSRNALVVPQAGATNTVVVAQPSAGNVVFTAAKELYDNSFFRNLARLASYRAFHQLTLLSAAHIYLMRENNPTPSPAQLEELDTEVRIFNYGRFVSTYFDAYFRGGQFIQFNVNQQDLLTALQSDLPSKIKSGLQPGDVSTYLQHEMTVLCTGLCNTTLANTAFITRAGLSVQFSGISYTVTTSKGVGLSHTYPQMTQVGPQLVRVLVEALFDANGLIPKAAPTSTACTDNLLQPDDCLKTSDTADLQTKIQQIDMYATTIETINSSVAGIIIRNTGFINNEAVAQTIETLFGVVSRKVLEKALYTASGGPDSDKAACPVKTVPIQVQQ